VGGPSRGGGTNEVALLQQSWQGTAVEKFSDAEALRTWQTNWPGTEGQPAAKVVYDRAAAEIRVFGKTPRGTFAKTFPLEPDLAMALKQAAEFIRAQMER